MQKPVVMAFRARLKNLGYTGIQIYRKKKLFSDQEIYKVVAYEPFTSTRCERYIDLCDMDKFR